MEICCDRAAAYRRLGLGYVRAPLAYSLARHYRVAGFDVNAIRVEELWRGVDRTHELPREQLADSVICLTADTAKLADADLLIVTVPTPVGAGNVPDLASVQSASETVGRHMKKGATVAYENTMYPGVTEEMCIPILARASGLRHGPDFLPWVLARAHPSRRPRPHADQGSRRRQFRNARVARRGPWRHHPDLHGPEHQSSRGREGHRERNAM